MGKTKIKIIDDSVNEKLDIGSEKIDKQSLRPNGLKEVGDLKLEKEAKNQTSNIKLQKPASNIKHPTSKARIRSKKYQNALIKLEKRQKLPAIEAVKAAQTGSYTKFEGTIEAHINTNAKNLRGLVSLPFTQGKKLRILAFGSLAKESGADIVGDEKTISDIENKKIDFDILVTTPEWMPKLTKIAKILGPRGLMPNPKNGTISQDLEKTITELQGGKTEYKTETNGQVIHLSVGKVSQKSEEIVANLKVIYNIVGRSKIQKISLSPTMGPSVKVDLSSLST